MSILKIKQGLGCLIWQQTVHANASALNFTLALQQGMHPATKACLDSKWLSINRINGSVPVQYKEFEKEPGLSLTTV